MQEQKPKKLTGFSSDRISEDVAKQFILSAYECEKQAGETLLRADEYKKKAYKYLATKGMKHLDVDTADKIIRLQASERTNITYYVDKLKEKLSKPILDEVISKNYAIIDIDLLKDVMKQYNVPAQALKDCVSVTEVVDKTRMDELFNAGHISIEQLKDCYNLNISTSMTLKEIQKKK